MGVEPTCSAWKADTLADRSRAHVSVQGGSRGTRTHNGHAARTCFRDRLLIQPDDFQEGQELRVQCLEPEKTRRPITADPLIRHLALDSPHLTLLSCGDRNRTCVTTVNSRLPVPARTPPQCHSVSVVGFEPTLSWSQATRRVHCEQGPGFPTR